MNPREYNNNLNNHFSTLLYYKLFTYEAILLFIYYFIDYILVISLVKFYVINSVYTFNFLEALFVNV